MKDNTKKRISLNEFTQKKIGAVSQLGAEKINKMLSQKTWIYWCEPNCMNINNKHISKKFSDYYRKLVEFSGKKSKTSHESDLTLKCWQHWWSLDFVIAIVLRSFNQIAIADHSCLENSIKISILSLVI